MLSPCPRVYGLSVLFHGHYLLGRGKEWTQASQEIPLVSLTAIEPGEEEMEKQRLQEQGASKCLCCGPSSPVPTHTQAHAQHRGGRGKEEEPQVEGHGRPAAAAAAHIQVGLIASARTEAHNGRGKMPRRIQGTMPGPACIHVTMRCSTLPYQLQ